MLCIFVKFYARQCEMKHRMLRLMQQKAYNSGNRRRMSHREAKARRRALQEMKEKYERKSEKWLCTLEHVFRLSISLVPTVLPSLHYFGCRCWSPREAYHC